MEKKIKVSKINYKSENYWLNYDEWKFEYEYNKAIMSKPTTEEIKAYIEYTEVYGNSLTFAQWKEQINK